MSDITTQCHKFSWCLMRHGHRGECSSIFYTSTGENRNGWTYVTCTCGWSSGPFHNAAYAQDALTHHASTATVSAGATPASEPPHVTRKWDKDWNPICVPDCPACNAAPPTPEPTVEQIARIAKEYAGKYAGETRPMRLREIFTAAINEYAASSSERVRELEAMRFEPLGDNHHNAAKYPYCNPEHAKLAAAEAQLTLALEMLEKWRKTDNAAAPQLAALLAQIGKARGKNAPGSSAGVTGTGE